MRPARKLRAGEVAARRRRSSRCSSIGARTGGRRHVHGRRCVGDARPARRRSTRSARCRCRRTSHAPLDRPRALPDRLRRRSPARRPRRRPGCTSRPSCSTRSPTRGVDVARSSCVVGLDTFQPVTEDDPLGHRMHSERYRVPAEATWTACRERRPGRRRRHDQRCGPSRARRRPARWRAAPSCSSTAATTFAGRRRAADQLPPAAHDAADDDRRLRRPPLARPLRHRAGRGLPVPVLRRRHAARSPAHR